jgi:hypothetical protein
MGVAVLSEWEWATKNILNSTPLTHSHMRTHICHHMKSFVHTYIYSHQPQHTYTHTHTHDHCSEFVKLELPVLQAQLDSEVVVEVDSDADLHPFVVATYSRGQVRIV